MQLSLPAPLAGAELTWPACADAERYVTSVCTSRADFDRLAAEWRGLESAATGPVLFQSYAWCRAVWDHWLDCGRPFEPQIVVARLGGAVVGLLPLQIVRRGPLRIATGLAEPFQQYTDAIIAAGRGDGVAAALLAAALRLDRCDGLEFLKVRDDSPLAGPLRSHGATRAAEDGAPYVELAPFAEFADYHATVKAKTRKNIRNARNRLARSHRLQHRVLSGAPEIATLVARAYRGRERWLQELGLTSRAFRESTFAQFLDKVAADPDLELLAMSLEVDDAPVADQWGLVFNRRYYAYAATWDAAYEEFSPGKLHLEDVIRACHERGIGTADFLMPAVRYKLTWTDSVMPIADYALPCSRWGRLYASLWIGVLRPQLKRLALAAPNAARGRLARLLWARAGKPAAMPPSAPSPAADPAACGGSP